MRWALRPDDRRSLLRIARAEVTATVLGRAPVSSDDPGPADGPLALGGAFVTLRAGPSLRGCVGRVETDEALVETVRDVARAAAIDDPRFAPVQGDELATLVIEVSVLGPLETCGGPEDVEVGRHGLVVEDGSRRGLLLPQVAVEWGWDRHVFVARVCRKAGLPSDAWRRGASLFTFEADVFSEGDGGPSGSGRP